MSRRKLSRPQPIVQEPPLAPLCTGIYRDGKLFDLIEHEDPRARFCRTYNELTVGSGFVALPIKHDATLAAAVAGKAVR